MSESEDVVLVTGPPRSGVTSVVAALGARMPGVTLVEADELPSGTRPSAVVVVVSGIAPIVESDCRYFDFAAEQAAAVIGAVSKVDTHRSWRDVCTADAATLSGRSARYTELPWAPVAAVPDDGPPNVAALVDCVRDALRANAAATRNPLRALHTQRSALIREHRRARSSRALAVRGGLAQLRSGLGVFLRRRCAEVRADFRARAAELPRGGGAQFEAELRSTVEEVYDELAERMRTAGHALAAELGADPPEHPGPVGAAQLPSRSAAAGSGERRVTTVLGAGFGLGVAMAVSRLLGGLARELSVAAFVAGGLAGLGLTAWLVMTRAVLQERALVDRWVTEVVASARWHGEEFVTGGVLAVEIRLAAASADAEDAESAELERRVGAIDAELRTLTSQVGRSESFL